MKVNAARQVMSNIRAHVTRHPPIDLFEDLLDPEDWDAAISLETKTNARVAASIGLLDLVPPERRVGGAGASYVMAPFTHVSMDHPGRFHDGTFGCYYAANDFETTIAETCHHQSIFFKATSEAPGWFSQYRELVGRIEAELHDVRPIGMRARIYAKDDWTASQTLAQNLRASGSNGVVYNSVRNLGGECIGAFWPDVVGIPIQARSLAYHFDGEKIDIIRDESNGDLFRITE